MLRAIYAFARERSHDDRATYHASATLERAPAPGDLADVALPTLLDHLDARQSLHVTFGSVLTGRAADGRPHFYDRLIGVLRGHAEAYAAGLEAHVLRHLARFVAAPRAAEAAVTVGGEGQ
jgi:hypothetical protein